MSLSVSDLEELSELYLEKRLKGLPEALAQCRERIGYDIQEHFMKSDTLSRGVFIGAFAETLESHCIQAADDLLGLMRAFNTFTEAESIRELLDIHVDASAAGLVNILSGEGFGGISSRSSEQKRIANLITGIKRQVRRKLDLEVMQEIRKDEQADFLESSEDYLDDRLPLNRRGAFDNDLVDFSQRAQNIKEPLSLVMVDIDHFKKVNDNNGHTIGDEVLIEVAQLLVKRCAHKGKAYRFGGEEFVLLIPAYSAEEAAGLAERIRKDIAASPLSSKKLNITASFGVACLPDQAADSRSLLESADASLYQAKRSGRNRVCSAGE